MPINIAGTEIHAKNAIPTGAPTKVPNCQSNFFFLDHGFLPQKVHPEEIHIFLSMYQLTVFTCLTYSKKGHTSQF